MRNEFNIATSLYKSKEQEKETNDKMKAFIEMYARKPKKNKNS